MTRQFKLILRIVAILFSLFCVFTLNKPSPVHAEEADFNPTQNTEIPFPIQAYHDKTGNTQLVTIDIEAVEPYFEENSIEHYAYMDIHSAEPEFVPVILEARNRIIFSHSWTDKEVNGSVLDEEGNVIETLPCFYDIFPSDWEVPCFPVSDEKYPIYHYG